MRPNQEQQEFIKARLQGMLYVQETYEELYDHLLTALEAMPDNVPFYNAVDHLIEYDLGGKRGIRAIQARYIKIAIKDFASAYFLTLGQSFKSILIFLVIAGTIGYYLLIENEFVSPDEAVMFGILSVLPAGLIVRKMNKSNPWMVYKTNHAMYYVGSYAAGLMIPFPGLFWQLTSTFCHYLQRAGLIEWLPGAHRGVPINITTVNIATMVFFVMLLHSLTFYRLYRDFPIGSIAK